MEGFLGLSIIRCLIISPRETVNVFLGNIKNMMCVLSEAVCHLVLHCGCCPESELCVCHHCLDLG